MSAEKMEVPKKPQGVIEMLEYVRALGIDPVKDAEMIWIAEEAYNAPLPPNWEEHFDADGRAYYHCQSTGESSWKHPMDACFQAIVFYYRQVAKDGGFWYVEDQLHELEDTVRAKLGDWMELYDQHGEKFYYNRVTQESSFDDPRVHVYHDLYTRIKMIAKMRDRLPMHARAPRPEAPTIEELELKRHVQEEEQAYLLRVLKVQSMIRSAIARRRARKVKAMRELVRGPRPLGDQYRLRLENLRGPWEPQELLFSITTPARRQRAATKIQTLYRGYKSRKMWRPVFKHHRWLAKRVKKMQKLVRGRLARIELMRRREAKTGKGLLMIQRCWRGYWDRIYTRQLLSQKLLFKWMVQCTLRLQTYTRMVLAIRLKNRLRQERFVRMSTVIARYIRKERAQRKLWRLLLLHEPVTVKLVLFDPCRDATAELDGPRKVQAKLDAIARPFAMQLTCAPLSLDGDFVDGAEVAPLFLMRPAVWKNWADAAAVSIQRRQRGVWGRRRVRHLHSVAQQNINIVLDRVVSLSAMCHEFLYEVFDSSVHRAMMRKAVSEDALDLLLTKTIERSNKRRVVVGYALDHIYEATVERSRRRQAVVAHCMDTIMNRVYESHCFRTRRASKIQARVRGVQCRARKWFAVKWKAMLDRLMPKIVQWQAHVKRTRTQLNMDAVFLHAKKISCSIHIQAAWRRKLARKVCKQIRDEQLYPLTLWFSYEGSGPDACHASLRIMPNQHFDADRHFQLYGAPDLERSIRILDAEIAAVVDSFFVSQGIDVSDYSVVAPQPPTYAHEGLHASLAGLEWGVNEELRERKFLMDEDDAESQAGPASTALDLEDEASERAHGFFEAAIEDAAQYAVSTSVFGGELPEGPPADAEPAPSRRSVIDEGVVPVGDQAAAIAADITEAVLRETAPPPPPETPRPELGPEPPRGPPPPIGDPIYDQIYTPEPVVLEKAPILKPDVVPHEPPGLALEDAPHAEPERTLPSADTVAKELEKKREQLGVQLQSLDENLRRGAPRTSISLYEGLGPLGEAEPRRSYVNAGKAEELEGTFELIQQLQPQPPKDEADLLADPEPEEPDEDTAEDEAEQLLREVVAEEAIVVIEAEHAAYEEEKEAEAAAWEAEMARLAEVAQARADGTYVEPQEEVERPPTPPPLTADELLPEEPLSPSSPKAKILVHLLLEHLREKYGTIAAAVAEAEPLQTGRFTLEEFKTALKFWGFQPEQPRSLFNSLCEDVNAAVPVVLRDALCPEEDWLAHLAAEKEARLAQTAARKRALFFDTFMNKRGEAALRYTAPAVPEKPPDEQLAFDHASGFATASALGAFGSLHTTVRGKADLLARAQASARSQEAAASARSSPAASEPGLGETVERLDETLEASGDTLQASVETVIAEEEGTVDQRSPTKVRAELIATFGDEGAADFEEAPPPPAAPPPPLPEGEPAPLEVAQEPGSPAPSGSQEPGSPSEEPGSPASSGSPSKRGSKEQPAQKGSKGPSFGAAMKAGGFAQKLKKKAAAGKGTPASSPAQGPTPAGSPAPGSKKGSKEGPSPPPEPATPGSPVPTEAEPVTPGAPAEPSAIGEAPEDGESPLAVPAMSTGAWADLSAVSDEPAPARRLATDADDEAEGEEEEAAPSVSEHSAPAAQRGRSPAQVGGARQPRRRPVEPTSVTYTVLQKLRQPGMTFDKLSQKETDAALAEMQKEQMQRLEELKARRAARQQAEARRAHRYSIDLDPEEAQHRHDAEQSIAEAKAEEMRRWHASKERERQSRLAEERAVLAAVRAKDAEEARRKEEQQREFEEVKKKRLQAHRRRREAAPAALVGKQKPEVVVRHVYHHVYHQHDGDELAAQTFVPVDGSEPVVRPLVAPFQHHRTPAKLEPEIEVAQNARLPLFSKNVQASASTYAQASEAARQRKKRAWA